MKYILLCVMALVSLSRIGHSQTEVTFYTNMGDFVVETYDTLQPITAGNFLDLVNSEFYDGIIFHRVIDDFMIQGGDPWGTGYGGPGYTIEDEFDPMTSNVQMAIAMANAGPNTGGSQFFINLVDNTYLDPNHPVFGIVIENFSVVQDIGSVPTNANDAPLTDVVMDSVRVTSPFMVGISEWQAQKLEVNVYPNPAENLVHINVNDHRVMGQSYLLRISDIVGNMVHSEYLVKPNTSINVSEFTSKGIYLVSVIDEQSNSVSIKRLVIQ